MNATTYNILSWHSETTVQKAAAVMLLKACEKHKILLSGMDSIINDVQSLFDIAKSFLCTRIHAFLQSIDTSQEVAEGIDFLIKNSPGVFEGLRTQQQQLLFFRKNFNFIVSEFNYSAILF